MRLGIGAWRLEKHARILCGTLAILCLQSPVSSLQSQDRIRQQRSELERIRQERADLERQNCRRGT